MQPKKRAILKAIGTTLAYFIVSIVIVAVLSYVPSVNTDSPLIHALFFYLFWAIPVALLLFGALQVFRQTRQILLDDPAEHTYSWVLTIGTIVFYLLAAPTVYVILLLVLFAANGGSL